MHCNFKLFKVIIMGLLLFGCRASLPPEAHWSQGAYQVKMASYDTWFARQYRVHIPRQYDPEFASPLVVVVHGAFSNAEETARHSGFSDLAERKGFIVVYPEGMGLFGLLQHWNAGHCCGRAEQIGLDDVDFIERVIIEVCQKLNIDQQRIYMAGMSNGGMLTHRFAAERSSWLAAAAVVSGVSGSMRSPDSIPWQLPVPQHPVPILIMHGLEDEIVPYRGGISPQKGGTRHFLPVSESVSFWRIHNQCPPLSERTYLLSGSIILDYWHCDTSGADVYFYTLKDWGHSWPSPYYTDGLSGDNPMKSFYSAEILWDFFDVRRNRQTPAILSKRDN